MKNHYSNGEIFLYNLKHPFQTWMKYRETKRLKRLINKTSDIELMSEIFKQIEWMDYFLWKDYKMMFRKW